MNRMTTDGLAAALAAHAGSAEDALAAVAGLAGTDLEGSPPLDAAGWLRWLEALGQQNVRVVAANVERIKDNKVNIRVTLTGS